MKTLFSVAATALVLSTFSFSAPAQAQIVYGNASCAQMQAELNSAIASGRVSPSQAQGLQNRINKIQNMELRYGSNPYGMTYFQQVSVNNQIRGFNSTLRSCMNNGWNRHYGWWHF